MRLEATNKNVRGGLNKPPPSQVGLTKSKIKLESDKPQRIRPRDVQAGGFPYYYTPAISN